MLRSLTVIWRFSPCDRSAAGMATAVSYPVIGPRTPGRGALPPAGPVARELKRVLVKVNSSGPRRTRQ